jgi:hypothetical protein
MINIRFRLLYFTVFLSLTHCLFDQGTVPFSDSEYACRCPQGPFYGFGEEESRFIHKKQCEYSMTHTSVQELACLFFAFWEHAAFTDLKAAVSNELQSADGKHNELLTRHFVPSKAFILEDVKREYALLNPNERFKTAIEHEKSFNNEKEKLKKAFGDLKIFIEMLHCFFEALLKKDPNGPSKALEEPLNYEDGLAGVVNDLYFLVNKNLSSGSGSLHDRFFSRLKNLCPSRQQETL